MNSFRHWSADQRAARKAAPQAAHQLLRPPAWLTVGLLPVQFGTSAWSEWDIASGIRTFVRAVCNSAVHTGAVHVRFPPPWPLRRPVDGPLELGR